MVRPGTALSYNPVVGALLGDAVLPRRAAPFEQISAAIAVRAALGARQTPRSVLFLVPEGTASTARYILAGLIAGNHGHEFGYGHLPAEEVRSLLRSNNVLLVTPAVSECVEDLESLKLGGTTNLTDLWDIVPLAGQTARASSKGRIFLANPGWAASRMLDRRYSAVIIDASHPRTLAKFETLMGLAREASPLRVAVAPILSGSALADLSRVDSCDVWLWDPSAKRNAWNAIKSTKQPTAKPAQFTLWVCDADADVDASLAATHQLLASATRSSTGRGYPGLRLAWSIFNRLRNLTVPLAKYEQMAAQTWAGSLARRIQMLADVQGHGDAVWDMTWPALEASVEASYRAFAKRMETAKFWALAERLQDMLPKLEETCRIVVPSTVEAGLLMSALQDVVDGLPETISAGRLEVVTSADEARRIAEGNVAHTLLVGPRPGWYRHLNLYPSKPCELLAYPFEAPIECGVLDRQYRAAVSLQGQTRRALLEELQLELVSATAGDPSAPPQISFRRSNGREVAFANLAVMDGALDLDALACGDDEIRTDETSERVGTARSGATIEVEFRGGERERYAVEELVDVYFPETEQVLREPVSTLAPGMRVIRFVDGRYDSLFRRTTEAIELRMGTPDRLALELWDKAKAHIAERYPNRADLFERLQAEGLESSYPTFLTWFRGDDAMAPQQIEDFLVIAKATELYRTSTLMRETFRCIQQVRGRNRAVGRKLRGLLRALLSQSGYEEALESVRRVDPDLADVYAAVDLVEVERIQRF